MGRCVCVTCGGGSAGVVRRTLLDTRFYGEIRRQREESRVDDYDKTYEAPERHVSCLVRHYFIIARKMVWSGED